MQTLHVDQKTFRVYAAEDILLKVQAYCSKNKRVEIVFYVYKKSSLKSETRAQRGKAMRRRVTESSKAPSNWKNFLRDDDNKTELFSFLARKIYQVVAESTIVVTNGEEIVSNKSEITESSDLAPCFQEEADTRIFVHMRHSTANGSSTGTIKANDTDVVSIAISCFQSFKTIGLEKLWIAFCQGAHSRWIPIHDIVSTIGARKIQWPTIFHAFSGCDVVSAFRG